MKRGLLIQNVSLFTISVFLALFIVEIFLRIMDYPPSNFSPWVQSPTTGFKYAPDIFQKMITKDFITDIRTNSVGLRDQEIGEKDGFRILLLGDSHTFGYGVNEKYLFANLLEERLGVEIINAGVGGFEIIHQVQYYRNHGKNFQPDLVIYAMYLGNDLTHNRFWRLKNNNLIHVDKKFQLTLPPQNHGIFRTVDFIKFFLKNRSYRKKLESETIKPWVPKQIYLQMCERRLPTVAEESYRQAKNLVKQLSNEVEKSGAEFFIFTFSYRNVIEKEAMALLKKQIKNFDKRYDLMRPENEMTEFFKINNIQFLNANKILVEHYEKTNIPLFFKSDSHLNEYGHSVIADILYPVIIKKMNHLPYKESATLQ